LSAQKSISNTEWIPAPGYVKTRVIQFIILHLSSLNLYCNFHQIASITLAIYPASFDVFQNTCSQCTVSSGLFCRSLFPRNAELNFHPLVKMKGERERDESLGVSRCLSERVIMSALFRPLLCTKLLTLQKRRFISSVHARMESDVCNAISSLCGARARTTHLYDFASQPVNLRQLQPFTRVTITFRVIKSLQTTLLLKAFAHPRLKFSHFCRQLIKTPAPWNSSSASTAHEQNSRSYMTMFFVSCSTFPLNYWLRDARSSIIQGV
jgi:hypothetical protein